MSDSLMNSPIRRAKHGLQIWLDLLPEDAKMDAQMALDRLCEAAEQEVKSAYFDGDRHSRDARRSDDARKQS